MTLPSWLEPLPDAALQRATDAWAIETLHIRADTLMERAGAGLAEQAAKLVPDGAVAVVCGKGNNGGDGFVAARLLREQGRAVTVLLLADPAEYQGDAKLNLDRLGRDVKPFDPAMLAGAELIIDAILGTGFSGEPHGPALDGIRAINAREGARVVACDVPSGVDASTGEVVTEAVRAELTVTFNAGKPGLWIHPGKAHARRVRVIDIGIPACGAPATGPRSADDGENWGSASDDDPDDLLAASNWLPLADLTARAQRMHPSKSAEPEATAITESPTLRSTVGRIGPSVRDLIPRRDLRSNKFTAGSVLVCGGSRGLTGAPVMAATAAARAGAGYVTVATPESVSATVEAKLLEVMTVTLPDDPDSGLRRGTSRMLVERADRAQSLVLGPGLGRLAATVSFARAVARYANLPLVIDADALNAHSADQADRDRETPLSSLKNRPAPTVLTPHVGELARLLGTTSAEVEARRLHYVRLAAETSGAVVVLKGDDTLVADPGGEIVAISPGAAPALATAGTGDVLSGIVGAFLAKGIDAFTAACAAVDTHLRAGRLASKQIGPEGVIASDVIATIPKVLAQGPRGGER